MSLYPTPVSIAELKAYMRLADNTSGIDDVLTNCLETATERVYSFCNWDWTRKLTAHPDPSSATYDQYNFRWITFMGDGTNMKRLNFTAGLIRQMSKLNPFATEEVIGYAVGSGAGQSVPSMILRVAGERRNILCGVDGFTFEKGYEYQIKIDYQLQDDATNRQWTIPDTVLMAITQFAVTLFKESGYGMSSLGHAEETGAFGQRVKLIDLDAELKAMLQPHREVPV